MTTDPREDVVSSQYEKWVYPAPILDLPGWLANNWQWFDPSHAHRIFWPDREYPAGMDILIAGCGTNQAAVFAYNNPTAKVVAIDVSQPSLDHHKYLIDKYAMKNLELHLLPVEEISTLGREFDLIVTTGVLHHLADPDKGMQALAAVMRPDAVMAVMLYATYGRLGVEMMQAIFRDLDLTQDEASIDIVRDAIGNLNLDHPITSYLPIAPDLEYDAGLVDTFLHGRDRDYTIEECIDLATQAGLAFQDVFLKSPYYAPTGMDSPFYERVAALPREKQWAVMERYNSRNACHFFIACRADRPKSAYVIDFSSDDSLNYVPSLRHSCKLAGTVLHKPSWSRDLNPVQATLMRQVDGRKTIGQITSGDPGARMFFQSLWQQDYLAMGII